MLAEGHPIKAHCNTCLRQTNHKLIAERTRSFHGGDDGPYEAHSYQMALCNGCGNVTFRIAYSDSETVDIDGDPIETYTYYPPKISRQKPKWLAELLAEDKQNEIYHLLDEIYSALLS